MAGDSVSAGPLDKMYSNTNVILLVLFGVFCSGLALILSLVAYFTGKDSKAKSNALIVIIVSIISSIGFGALRFGLLG